MKKIITYGTYDMLHIGHLNILQRAKALGDYLIVGVTSEDYDRSRGKLNVSQSTNERVEAIRRLDFVDDVIIETHKNQKAQDMQKYNIDIFAIGDDWIGGFDYLNEYTRVQYLPRTEGISSTLLRKKKFKTVKLGMVGLGIDTKRFLRESEFVSNIRVYSIFDDDIEAVERFIKSTDIEYGYSDYEAFLHTSIDAIYISSFLENHYKQIKMALDSGKHVLCENPLVIGENELEELFSLAKEKNRLLLVALKTAFAPAFNQLLKELQTGIIGDIKEVRASFSKLYKEKGYSKSFYEHGATNLLLSYPSLLIQKVLGESKSISFFDQREDGYDMANRAITTHENGSIGLATVGIGMKLESDAVIAGTKGYLYIPAPWWLTKSFHFRFEDTHKSYKFKYEFEGDGLRYMISEFSSLIQRGEIESKRLTQSDMIEINKITVNYNRNLTKELDSE
jgi:glycerol-3-phosphate cytidylyltransferase